MFDPVPEEVLKEAGRLGKAPLLLQALHEAVMKTETEIKDWTPFVTESRTSSKPTAMAD